MQGISLATRVFCTDNHRPQVTIDATSIRIEHRPTFLKHWWKKRLDTVIPIGSVVEIWASTVDLVIYVGFRIALIDEAGDAHIIGEFVEGFKEFVAQLPSVFPGFDQQTCERTSAEMLLEVSAICWTRDAEWMNKRG